tara:strand:- start:106 stop:357 length:252 start_codon:yes stop_codon:yes gene_type:complete
MKPTKNQTEKYDTKDHHLQNEFEIIEEAIETFYMLWERDLLKTFEHYNVKAVGQKLLQERKQKVDEALTNIKNSLCDGRCINE